MSKSLRYVLVSGLLSICFALPATAQAGTIDAFMDPFDAETNPVSTSFMWAGTYVPDSSHMRSKDTQDQPQIGESLDHVWDGLRYTSLSVKTTSTYVTAAIDTVYHKLTYTTAVGKPAGILSLTYDSQDGADISLASDTYFKLSYTSNLTSCHPMSLQVTVTCNAQPYSKSYSIYGSNSNKRLPFSDFGGCDFTKVTSIEFTFDASLRTGVNYTLTNGLFTGH